MSNRWRLIGTGFVVTSMLGLLSVVGAGPAGH
jgi:hypothetical protein